VEHGPKLSATGKRLLLSKIGDVKIIFHRSREGASKTATIGRAATGKRFVTISCEWEPIPSPPTGQQVGAAVGPSTYATLTEGDRIENPRCCRQEETALAKTQRKHEGALDAHKATRAEATERVKQAQPDLDEQGVWERVSHSAAEHANWKHLQQRCQVVARTY
jgi:transposase